MKKCLWLALIGLLAVASLASTVVTLPQNLWIANGTLYEGFENVSDWTVDDGILANNSSERQSGTQSIKLTADAGAIATMTKTVYWDLSSSVIQQIQFWAYQHNTAADYSYSLELSLSNDINFANYFQVWLVPDRMREVGWHRLVWPKSWFKVGAGSPSWSSPIVRVRFRIGGATGKAPSFSLDDLEMGRQSKPAVLLDFDDGYSTQYTNAFLVMRQHNIRGTLYAWTGAMDSDGHLTWSQLREMAAAGWTVGNHSRTHTSLATLTEAEQETELTNAVSDLTAQGLGAGAKYVAYPSGEYNDDTMTAMSNLGMRTGRTVDVADALKITPYPAWILPNVNQYDAYHLPWRGAGSDVSLASLENEVDRAIVSGTILPLSFHGVGLAGQISTADFKALIEYIAARRDSIDAITIDDMYQLTLGSLEVPKMELGTIIQKSVVPSIASSGQLITYTLAFTNEGTSLSQGVVITDLVPAQVMNLSYVSSGVRITPTGATKYVWNVADMAVGQGGRITVTGVVSPALAPGMFTNAVTLDGPTDIASSSVNLTVLGPPALSIGKSVSPKSGVAYHGQITYTVAVTNSGSGNAYGVLLTDTLPISTTFVKWVSQPSGSNSVGGQITWNGSIPAGQKQTWIFVASHTGGYGEAVVNTARFGHITGSGSAQARFTVLGPPSLSIGKSVTPKSGVAYHGLVTYTVAVTNSGASDAAGLYLTDTLPISTTFVQWVSQPGGSSSVGDQITWNGSVPAGQTKIWTFVASHTGGYGDVVVNTARYGHATGSGNSAAQFAVLGPPSLSIGKSVTPKSGMAYHGLVTYTVTVTNSGASDAAGLFLTDTLPISTTFVQWVSQPGGSSSVGDQITWNGNVPAAQKKTWTFVASHTGGYGEVVVNTARYGHITGSGNAVAAFSVLGAPGLSIGKSVTPRSGVAYHGLVTYTVAITNSGASDAAGLYLTDTLPISTTFVQWVSQPGGSSSVGDQITWNGSVPTGQTKIWTFVASHTGGYGDVVVNTARYGHTTGSGSAATQFTVLGPPELSIGKTVTPMSGVALHGLVTYTVAITNGGESPALSVSLTDTLPVSTTFANWVEQSGATYHAGAPERITWNGAIPAGQVMTWSFVVTHTGGYRDVVANTAGYDHAGSSGSAEATFRVVSSSRWFIFLPVVVKAHNP